MKLAWSFVKCWPILGLLWFISPPIWGLRGKNVVGSFLPSMGLNDLLLDFLLNLLCLSQHVCLMLELLLIVHFPSLAFIEVVQLLFLL